MIAIAASLLAFLILHPCDPDSPRFVIPTPLIGKTNELPNAGDDAFYQRLALIEFECSITGLDPAAKQMWGAEYNAIRPLLSALLPDYEQLLVDGELDTDAIEDCCRHLAKALRADVNDRVVRTWGHLLYYRILIERMAQAGEREYRTMFEWMARASAKQASATTRHTPSTQSSSHPLAEHP